MFFFFFFFLVFFFLCFFGGRGGGGGGYMREKNEAEDLTFIKGRRRHPKNCEKVYGHICSLGHPKSLGEREQEIREQRTGNGARSLEGFFRHGTFSA